ARTHGVGTEKLDRLLDAVVVRARGDGQAGGVRDDAAVGVVESDPVVVDLIDHGVVGGPAEVSGHLVGTGDECMPDDLESDGVLHAYAPSEPTVMTSSPRSP